MKLRTLSGLAAAFVLGYGIATWLQAPTPGSSTAAKSTSATQSRDNAPNLIIAGAYSRRCATASGICTMPNPQQVGTRCSCPNGTYGTVVR
jgi:hypothetical protein